MWFFSENEAACHGTKNFVQVRKIYQTRPAITGHYEISESDGTKETLYQYDLKKLVDYKTPKHFQRKNFISEMELWILSVVPKQALSGTP